MRRGFVASLRLRRPTAVVVAGLIALQAFLAGLAAAQAVIVLTAGPADVAVICHGQGGGNPDHGSTPDPLAALHLCCVACACGGPAAAPAQAPSLPRPLVFRGLQIPAPRAAAGPIAARAVRDGPSQAPPTLA